MSVGGSPTAPPWKGSDGETPGCTKTTPDAGGSDARRRRTHHVVNDVASILRNNSVETDWHELVAQHQRDILFFVFMLDASVS